MIELFVTSLLLLSFGLTLLIVLRPDWRADRIGMMAVLALLAAVPLAGWELALPAAWAVLPLLVAAAALIPAVTVARGFGRIDMIAFLFHKDFGLQGATLAGLKNQIVTAVLAALVLVATACLLGNHWGRPEVIALLAAAVLLVVNPFLRLAVGRLVAGPVISVLLQRMLPPRLRPGAVATPDLVIVYLEGTDRRFADQSSYGSTYRNLEAFAAEGLSFNRVGQIVGTGWSLAGMVASQSGVPVPPRALRFVANLRHLASFMPGVTFLGDVLAAKGYQRRYVVGSDPGFGGIGVMYDCHGVTAQTGSDEMREMFPAAEFAAAQVDWFLDDQMTLDAARRAHLDLVRDARPFALIVETIGPHGPTGYLSRRNTRSGRAEKTLDVPQTVSCLIDEVMAFLADLRAEQAARGRDLRIVLLSDHLNHTAILPKGGEGFAGFNTVVLWGDPADSGRVIDRPGSMVDVFPTLLDWLGWSEAPGAGIGRSLLAEAPTLIEEFGIAAVDRMIVGDAAFSNLVWGEAPQLAESPATA